MLTLFSSCVYDELPPPYPSNAYSYVDDERTLVAAGGWPFPYTRDGSVSSPMGSANILGVWVESDEFLPTEFHKTHIFWQSIAALIFLVLFFRRQRKADKTKSG